MVNALSPVLVCGRRYRDRDGLPMERTVTP
jgi:hypothetical protein